jgi:hypothetical protein
MSKFCNAFSFFILDSILDRSPSPLGSGRYLTVHNGDPGEDGNNDDITSYLFGTTALTFDSFAFDTTPIYDSANDRFYISNTNTLTSNESATSSGTIYWVTIWDDNNTPIVRVPFQSPYTINMSDYFILYPGQMEISVKNTGAEVASAILSCVWDSTSFNLILGNFQLALFSSITGISGTEVNDPGLNRISINKALFVGDSIPSYPYSGTATWGTSTTAGSSNAFVLLDDSNKVISYQLFPITWPAGRTLGIQANNFVLGVD